MIHTHQTAATQLFVEANGIHFAYRRFGKAGAAADVIIYLVNSFMLQQHTPSPPR